MAMRSRSGAACRGFLVGVAAGVWLGAWLAREGRARCAQRVHAALDAVEDLAKSAVARGRAWVGPRPLVGPPPEG